MNVSRSVVASIDDVSRLGSRTKAALEFGPIVAFVLGYLVVREQTYVVLGREFDGFVLLIGAFVPLVLAAGAVTWRVEGKVAPVQVLSLVIVALSGGLTLGFNDERFFKMRTTVVCITLAAGLWVGLLRGRSYLREVLHRWVETTTEGWLVLSRRSIWFLLMLAGANEFVWRGFSTDVWVAYDTFVQPLVLLGFMTVQTRQLRRRGGAGRHA